MLRLIGLVILATFLTACTIAAAAEPTPTPTPTPKPPAPSPQNVTLSAGDEPYIQTTWGQPPEDVLELGFEIQDEHGNGRPMRDGVRGQELIWLFYEGQRLRDAGCTVTNTLLRLTENCLDRFDPPGGMMQPFPRGYLKHGLRYEVRVMFHMPQHEYDPYQSWSSVQSVTIPNPPRPTSTPSPTVTPRPTSTPRPASTQSPSAPEPGKSTDVPDLFRNNSILVAVWELNNRNKTWKGYDRNQEPKNLRTLRPGRAYWFEVSQSGSVAGHSLYYDQTHGGWNMVAW